MNDNNELESLDGGLPHCCDNPADKLDSKMTEREQFEKEWKCPDEKDCPHYFGDIKCVGCAQKENKYTAYLESKLSTLREDITGEAIMLIKEYALCPDEKLTGDAIKLKRKIVEAMGGDKISKVREWAKSEIRMMEGYVDLEAHDIYSLEKVKELKQILEGK